MSNREPSLVAAIDFGTMYSGYAFSVRESFQKDPLSINVNQVWNAGGHQLLSVKTPTTLLLNTNKQLVAFGYQAENRYTELVMDGKLVDYYYFHRFKMKLYENERLSNDMEIADIKGKLMPALDVFALSIEFLKEHLMMTLSTQGLNFKSMAIQWVLTVPSIWTDTSKHFMRQSAIKAGIPSDNLVVSLESEAASIFCQSLPIQQLIGADNSTKTDKKGTQYMVVDIGGGTTDITALENLGKNQLKEICRATGGDCGGTSVDEEFYRLFTEIVGNKVMEDMIKTNPTASLDLFRAFECVKRSLTSEETGKKTMAIPFLTLTQLCEKHLKKDFVNTLKNSKYEQHMCVVNDKLRIEIELLRNMFKSTTDKIVRLVYNTLHGIDTKRTIHVILVGGFSESVIVQNALKTGLPYHRIIVPHEPSMSVLKGAVIFGYKPGIIVSRVVRYTYGFQVSNDFNPKLHGFLREVEVDGLKLCEKVFEKFIKIHSTVSLGGTIRETFTTTKKFQELHYLPLYTSIKEQPEYTDEDNCTHVGNVVVRIPNPTEEYRDVVVEISFGHTELKIQATDVESGNKCQTTFDYA